MNKTGSLMLRVTFLLFLLFVPILPDFSQEYTTMRNFQPGLKQSEKINSLKTGSKGTLVTLPFFDDFSRPGPFPDPELWTDYKAYVNTGYGINPPTIGIATLDVLDSAGRIYPQANVQSFKADFLSSQPLKMDFLPSDSIYLSFSFQPQGLGDMPDPKDSLVLEFFAPGTSQWKKIWSAAGDSVRPFKKIIIPVTDTSYLHSGFRFRFTNLASLTYNANKPWITDNDDQWHIDYIYLNVNRNYQDTLFDDIAFVNPIPSPLNTYESVPWPHFPFLADREMKPYLELFIRNPYNEERGVERHYATKAMNSSYYYTLPLIFDNISPFSVQPWNPDIEKFPQDHALQARFLLTSWLISDTITSRQHFRHNDTIRREQVFSDYYAYDDGTAEFGYGIFGEGATEARLAVKFIAPVPDSLREIRMYFNQSWNDVNQEYFKLTVWNDRNGLPGDILFSEGGSQFIPKLEGLNDFVSYPLPSLVSVPDTFYVGWIQTSEAFLNLGLDVNNDHSNRVFYNLSGSWMTSKIKGSLMIRPVVGKDPATELGQIIRKNASRIRLYPNPASSVVYFDNLPESATACSLQVFSLQGQLIHSFPELPDSLDISQFSSGIYLFILRTTHGTIQYEKLQITH